MGVITSLTAITPAVASDTQGFTAAELMDVAGNYKLALLKLVEAKILLTAVQTVMAAASDANATNVNTQITALS